MVEFKVEDRVFEAFPEFQSSIAVCKDIDNSGVDKIPAAGFVNSVQISPKL